MQLGSLAPETHLPAPHTSPAVHSSPSLQTVPSADGELSHWPSAHTFAVQGSPSSHSSSAPHSMHICFSSSHWPLLQSASASHSTQKNCSSSQTPTGQWSSSKQATHWFNSGLQCLPLGQLSSLKQAKHSPLSTSQKPDPQSSSVSQANGSGLSTSKSQPARPTTETMQMTNRAYSLMAFLQTFIQIRSLKSRQNIITFELQLLADGPLVAFSSVGGVQIPVSTSQAPDGHW